jgi:hypothetical protein
MGRQVSDYDTAFATAAQGLGGAAPPQNEYDAIMSGIMPKAEQVTTPVQKPKQGTGSDIADSINAVGTGYFKGLTSLIGLPGDTAANISDLGKAAMGTPYTAITGKAAPDWLMPNDRKNVFGTGAYILDKARQTALGRYFTQAVNPEYEGGYLQAAGGALNGIVRPQTLSQAANQGALSVAGTLAGKAVGDATGNPALAITASLLPTAAQYAGAATLKAAVRGGESGRKDMEQRIQDLKAAGVENPTLGLASGNSLVGGVENLLQSTPGAVKVMRNARDSAVNGLQEKANAAADLASKNRGSLESGVAIQEGIKSFKDAFKDKQAGLYGRLDEFIPGSTPVNVSGTKSTLSALNADIPGAPELSKQFKNARIMAIEDAINKDTAGTAPGVVTTTRGAGGLMNQPEVVVTGNIPGGSSTNLLPFEAVKKTRTLVGNEIADNSLVSTVPRSKWNALYGSLSGDMGTAATQAGPQATVAFNRANDFTRAGLQRLDRVAPFANRDAPEQSYKLLNQTLGDNVSTLQAVKKSLPEGARGTVAGTVIEKLGTARPGNQNDTGSVWSPDTFLTNWNKMKPEARQELFSGFQNSKQVMDDVSSIAKATSMMRDSSKLWANPSGTSANLAARGTIGAIAGGGLLSAGGLLNPVVPVAAAGGMLGAYGAARAVTSPRVVNSAAQRTYIDPEILNAQVNALIGGGLLDQR